MAAEVPSRGVPRRGAARAGPPAPARAAPPGRCGSRTRSPRRRGGRPRRPTWTVVSSWPATTCALVTTTPSPATQPLPCTPEPAGRAEHAGPRCGPPRAPPGRGRSSQFGRPARPASGPSICGNGSKRASACRIGPDGGSTLVQLAEDRRPLDRLAQLARARRLERDRAADPDEPEPERRHQQPRRRSRPARPRRSPMPVAQAEAEQLERRGEDRRPRAARRPARTAARRASCEPSSSSSGPSREPRNAPAGEPGQRQRPYDQPLGVAPDRHQHREGDDDPVQGGHAPKAR